MGIEARGFAVTDLNLFVLEFGVKALCCAHWLQRYVGFVPGAPAAKTLPRERR